MLNLLANVLLLLLVLIYWPVAIAGALWACGRVAWELGADAALAFLKRP
jgi:hypothetical protein